jgi:DNA invertase Pin-like site-specific DNA recombinase
MSYLIEYGIKFVCTDCANDDAMMLKLRTVFNEEENLRRSQRTSSALQQKKRQGFKLGSTTGFTDEMRKKAAVVNAKSAIDSKENKQAMHVICGERKAGKTLQEIADKLNTLEYKTRRGKAFSKTTVNRLFARCASLKSS